MLHRDMSDKNIMFLRQGGRAHGRLCDWDLTKHVRGSATLNVPGSPGPRTGDSTTDGRPNPEEVLEGEAEPTVADLLFKEKHISRRRTPPGPFIQIDLLRGSLAFSSPVPLYCYDLESLFYILVWFCVHFDPKLHCYRECPGVGLREWFTGTCRTRAQTKIDFLMRSKYDYVTSLISPQYSEMADKWIYGWWRMFFLSSISESEAMVFCTRPLNSEEAKRRKIEDVKSAWDGFLTYGMAMAALGEREL
jgi:hypothetical protein